MNSGKYMSLNKQKRSLQIRIIEAKISRLIWKKNLWKKDNVYKDGDPREIPQKEDFLKPLVVFCDSALLCYNVFLSLLYRSVVISADSKVPE
jgi:hypothetical protein